MDTIIFFSVFYYVFSALMLAFAVMDAPIKKWEKALCVICAFIFLPMVLGRSIKK